MYELQDIKRIRKKLNMTQFDLAKRANVSQSLIAKIEAQKIDPTYSKVRQLFTALEDLEKKGQLSASQMMSTKIISLHPSATIKEAIALMRKHQISQVPVLENHQSLGTISESVLLDSLVEGKGSLVKEVMADAPPIVPKGASVAIISALLRHSPMVLVSEQGKLVGVLTKSDLLGKAFTQ